MVGAITHRGPEAPSATLLTQDGEEAFVCRLVEDESAQWKIKKPTKPTEAGFVVGDHALLELDTLTLQIALDTPQELAALRRLMTGFVVVDVVTRLAVHPSMLITDISPKMGLTDSIEVSVSFEEHRTVATRLIQLPAGNGGTGRGGGQATAAAAAAAATVTTMAEAAEAQDAARAAAGGASEGGAGSSASTPTNPGGASGSVNPVAAGGAAASRAGSGPVPGDSGMLPDHARTMPGGAGGR